MSADDSFQIDADAGVAIVRLARPERRKTIDREIANEPRNYLQGANTDSGGGRSS